MIYVWSGYQRDNYRLHCYLDSPEVPRIPNRTFLYK